MGVREKEEWKGWVEDKGFKKVPEPAKVPKRKEAPVLRPVLNPTPA